MKQTADERFARAEDELDRFGRLNESDNPRQDAEHTCFRATGRGARRRRLRKQTAVTRSAQVRCEDAGLSFKAKNGTVNVRLAREDANVIREIARGKIIGAIDHQIVERHDLWRVLAAEPAFVLHNFDARIRVAKPCTGCLQFLFSDIVGAIKNLTLQIRMIDSVDIDQTDTDNHSG